MSLRTLLFGRRKQHTGKGGEPSPSEIRPAKGWISVGRGTPELVQEAVESYADTFREVKPKEFHVRVADYPGRFLAVTFPDGIPPYSLVNLIGWLDQPPGIEGVASAAGWITSPASGLRYALQPDPDSIAGDTLIGCSSEGTPVQVYQPEATMCETSRRVATLREPDLSKLRARSIVNFSVTFDVDPSFGNPGFRITHPKDTDW